MTVKDICKVHYFSCVEAYFGAWIMRFIQLPLLYAQSYLPWNEIVRAFEDDSVEYINFPHIPRIQDFAERIGIVTHRKQRGLPQNVNRNDLLLLSVKENFFSKRKPWRSDHYIAAELTGKKIKYCNEYPLVSGEIEKTAFNEQFGGESLVYSLLSCDLTQAKKICMQQITAIYEKRENYLYPTLPLNRLRDAIGILRVSRKRTVEWLAKQDFISGKDELRKKLVGQIEYADNCYFRLQSIMIRNGRAEERFLKEITEQIARFEQ